MAASQAGPSLANDASTTHGPPPRITIHTCILQSTPAMSSGHRRAMPVDQVAESPFMLDKLQAGPVRHLAPEVVSSDDHPLHLGT